MWEIPQTFQIVKQGGVQTEPFNVWTQLGDELQVVGAQQFHGVEEDSLESEHRQYGVRRVEVYVGEHVRHDVIDHVFQSGDTVQQESDTLGGDALEEAGHDDGVKVPATEEPRQAGVCDIGSGDHQTLQSGTVYTDDAGNVIITYNYTVSI